jgi:predicted metal-dependent hydrolase
MNGTVEAANQHLSAQVQEAIAAAIQQHAGQVKGAVEAANQQHSAQVQEAIAAAIQQHAGQVKGAVAAAVQQSAAQVNDTVSGVNQRLAAAEQNMEEIRKHFTTLQENVAGDLHDFEQSLKTQAVAIESARTAMAQTDDLVERVVEALELLQSSVLDQHLPSAVN